MGVVNYLTIDGEIVSETRNGVKSDYIPDPLGSTSKLVNTSQSVTDVFEFWPYGELKLHTGGSGTPFRFGGTLGYYTHSPSTRLYVRARWPRVDLGRWQILDLLWPLESAYAYVDSSPVAKVDQSGYAGWIECHCAWWCQIGPGYTHAFLSLNGCTFGSNCGFWPANQTIPPNVVGVSTSSDTILCPDPNAPNIGKCCHTIKSIDDPSFDRALCACIAHSFLAPPKYGLCSFNCGSWTSSMWECAKKGSAAPAYG